MLFLWIINATANHALPHVGERGQRLCPAQKHTENISCILLFSVACFFIVHEHLTAQALRKCRRTLKKGLQASI